VSAPKREPKWFERLGTPQPLTPAQKRKAESFEGFKVNAVAVDPTRPQRNSGVTIDDGGDVF
jgi:hypothetical protein